MLFRLRRKLAKARFNAAAKDILKTLPIRPCDDGLVILSAVGNDDVLMYLVAVKSFHHFLRRGRMIVLVQDDCPQFNIDIIRHHVQPLRILRDSEVRLGECPQGGTWERLVSVVREAESQYVIQLDSDTVTVSEIPEIAKCVELNRSFMIGTWRNQDIISAAEARDMVKDVASTHVQMLAEKNLGKLTAFASLRYARGQSSLAGFSRGCSSFSLLEEFSRRMEDVLGAKKWREWGSESVASNFVIANSSDAIVLPFPKYATYMPPSNDGRESVVVHFEGTHRFKDGRYIASARDMISRIGANAPAGK